MMRYIQVHFEIEGPAHFRSPSVFQEPILQGSTTTSPPPHTQHSLATLLSPPILQIKMH
jgi:hypothetical protein